MVKKFNSIINSMICLSIISILVGIAMMVWPGASIFIIAMLGGIYFIVEGIVQIVIGIKATKYHLPYDGTAYGVLSVLFGIICVVVFAMRPDVTVVTFGIIYGIAIGVWVIIAGVYDIKAASLLKKVPNSRWGLILAFGIICILLGIALMITPVATTISFTIIIGISLIVFGVVKLVDTICLRSQAEHYEKAVKNKAADISEFINKGVNTASDLYKEGKDIVEDQIDKFKN